VIRRLALKNWRNYQDIDLELQPGTTFIVAPNGVGKTSLMEAAAWAIFGDSGQRPDDAVRLGASSALATAEIEFPDQRILSITRTLPKKPGAALPPPTISLDGKQITGAAASDEIRDSYSADPVFLARLTMPRGHADDKGPADFGLHGHLCHFFGIEGLLRAADSLDLRIKAQQKQIRQAKEGSLTSPAALTALRERVAELEAAAAEAAAAHGRESERLDKARETERYRAQLDEWQERRASHFRALGELASSAAPDVALDPERPDTAAPALDNAAASVQRELEALRVQQARLAGRSTAIAQHAEELESAHGDCPVCRRPLDTETVRFARSAHQTELERIQTEAEQLNRQEVLLVNKQRRVQSLIQTFRDLPQPGPRPAGPISADPTMEEARDELDAKLQLALDQLVERRAALATSQAELRAAMADDAAHAQLQRLYGQEAMLRASRDAISAATDKLLNETIQPLAREIDVRWAQWFPRRGRLTTLSTGAVSRELAGENLPDSAFSTGERTGLVILLRLLVLETATKANFCWFDEPLEHLDPDARRQVAGSLARVSTAGPLRQIVVTTYEEPLARRVQERDPQNVRLIYVRPSPD
jgi:DNA repair exonuclease SbcCD ATPase subunit